METANFYWTVIVGITAALWIGVQFIRRGTWRDNWTPLTLNR